MKYNHLVSLFAALLLGAGCSPVQMAHPFAPNADHPDREKLAGVWQSGDGFLHVSFSTNGTGRLAIPEWRGDDFKVDRGEFTIISGEHGSYFSAFMPEEKGTAQDGWSLGEYRINDDALIIWWANPAPFAKGVESGALKGTLTTNNGQTRVSLSASPEDVLKFINAQKEPALFDYRSPGVFHKIAK